MTNETNAVFDKDAIPEKVIGRRDLMPLALKIYVWGFLLLTLGETIKGILIYIKLSSTWDTIKPWAVLGLFGVVLLPFLEFLSNLFILMEKKWAILMGLITTGVPMLLSGYSTYMVYSGTRNVMSLFIAGCWLLVQIPYFVMLLNIKNKWETIAVAKAP